MAVFIFSPCVAIDIHSPGVILALRPVGLIAGVKFFGLFKPRVYQKKVCWLRVQYDRAERALRHAYLSADFARTELAYKIIPRFESVGVCRRLEFRIVRHF